MIVLPLLLLLAIGAGVPRAEKLFGIVSVVVVLSMVVHGGSATPVLGWYGRRLRQADLPEEVATDAETLFAGTTTIRNADQVPRTSVQVLKAIRVAGTPVTVIDVRREAAFAMERQTIP